MQHNCNRNSAFVYVLVSTLVSCPSLRLIEQRAGHDRVHAVSECVPCEPEPRGSTRPDSVSRYARKPYVICYMTYDTYARTIATR